MRGTQYLHPELQHVVEKFLDECKKQGLPVLITETWRAKQEQDNFYAQGRTKSGNIITNAKYPYSPHCWGVAFDFCRNVKGREYDNSDKFFEKVGRIAEKMFDNTEFDLFWGGDWRNFVDKPHVEMKKYMPNGTTKYLVEKYGNPDNFKKTWGTFKEDHSELYEAVKRAYGFDENTMEYLHAFKHRDALMQAFIDKRPISPATEEYVLGYKYGGAILSRVYG